MQLSAQRNAASGAGRRAAVAPVALRAAPTTSHPCAQSMVVHHAQHAPMHTLHVCMAAAGGGAAPRAVPPARRVAAAATSADAPADPEVEEIDPMTGMPIGKASVRAKVAGQSIQAGKYTWSYRRTDKEDKKKDLPVLLLHGLGSSSYSYRNTLSLLGGEGYDAVAPDWVGHGTSEMPADFDCSEGAYVQALGDFVDAIGIRQPFALVVQGFILGQYALKYALANPDKIDRLLILNTPVARSSKLRPELAAYKNPIPFLRPGSKPFDGATYAIGGSPYAMKGSDAATYGQPYVDSPAASEIIAKTMDKVDFPRLLADVDDGFRAWRIPTAMCFGSSDAFLDLTVALNFLDDKRTNMKALSMAAKVGHMPQEDYPEMLHTSMMLFLEGSPEEWTAAQAKSYKMTKKGAVDA